MRLSIPSRAINPLSLRFLLAIVLLEIFIGGGGRLFNAGPGSIRMYFYVITLAIGGMLVARQRRLPVAFIIILGAATCMFIFSSIIGKINGAPVGSILADIKPLLPFYTLLFFYATIDDIRDVAFVVKLLKFSAVVMALLYVVLFLLINMHVIPFLNLYNKIHKTDEFFFRGQFAFFYKGFIYMCFGAIFYVCDVKRNKWTIGLLALAIVLTFTRGFFVSILLTFFFYYIFIIRSPTKLILFFIGVIVATSVLWGYYNQKALDRRTSDSSRFAQIIEVKERTTFLSSIIGHGYGVGIPSRPERMEIVFLEMFHKQGIIGLGFWFGLAGVCWVYYRRAIGKGYDELATSFLLCVVFLYIESLSNPYLTNPIGLNMVLVSLVCLRILGAERSQVLMDKNTEA